MHSPDAVLIGSCVGAPRDIAGGSDAELVTAIITGPPLCIECIARRTGVPASQVDTVLARIGMTLRLTVEARRCAICLEDKMVFALYRSPDPRPRPTRRPVTYADELWRFLQEHRGAMFCTHCLASAIGATTRIDRAVMTAEGRGATRRYDRCAACGRERLVCGLPG